MASNVRLIDWLDGMPWDEQRETGTSGGPSDSTEGPEMPPSEALGQPLHV
jgi:hypothetical protein